MIATGLATLLATSPPLPPSIHLVIEPDVVCPGDAVTASWIHDGPPEGPPPSDVRIVTEPVDIVAPPLDGVALAEAEPPLTTTARRSGYASLSNDLATVVTSVAELSVLLCDELGRQWDDGAWRIAAMKADPRHDHVILALTAGSDATRLVTLSSIDGALRLGDEVRLDGLARDLTFAPTGERFVAGRTHNASGDAEDGPPRGYLQAFAGDGAPAWTALFDAFDVLAVVAAPGGDVLVAGTRGEHVTEREGFLSRYDDAGELRWRRSIASTVSGTSSGSRSLALADDGTSAVGGTTTGEVAGPRLAAHDAFLVTFDADGNRGWELQAAGHARAGGVVRDGDRWVLAASDLLAFESDGTGAWTLPTPPGEVLVALRALPSGGVVAAYEVFVDVEMATWRSLDHLDVTVRRIDAAGSVRSERRFGSLADDQVSALTPWPSLEPDAVVVAGSTRGSVFEEHPGFGLHNFVLVLGE